MRSKTPNFDKSLEEYYKTLVLDERGGQWRTCRFSGEKFYVRPEDVGFYKKIGVPLPSLSPKERIRKKLSFHNSYNLFRVASAFSGKSIVSQYPSNAPYPIFEHQVWFGGEWDALEYGAPYDGSRGFFDQFKELQNKVPRPSLDVDNTNVESEYTNWSVRLKRCYLVFDAWQAEDSAYSISIDDSRECFDCFAAYNSESCADCLEGSNLFRCFFSEYSKDCLDSSFLFDCRDCNHCFMCSNLRHKSYYFLNQPLTKEEYNEKIGKMNVGNFDVLTALLKQFGEMKARAVYKENHNDKSVNSSGDYLRNCNNCHSGFYNIDAENDSYTIGGLKVRDSYDSFGGADSELIYDSHGGINCYGLKFSFNIRQSRNLEYCDLLTNCRDCFGCIGLRNKSFCILNKQFTESDYWKEMDNIKADMMKKGEYGEFFPPFVNPVPYNISVATSYKGYDDAEIAKRYGYRIEEILEPVQEAGGEVLNSSELPKDIGDVEDDILDKVIFDDKNKKHFRYIKKELDFYRRFNLPLPREHPSVRMEAMRKKFGTVALEFYDRPCMKCGKTMQSVYALERPETVYCESCYNSEVV
jgi:hypothetical protein